MTTMENNFEKALEILRRGGLVAFATETVYGLGADAKNPDAISKIFAAKQRPADFPLNILIPDVSHLAEWAIDIPENAYRLAEAFWPGPLTLILKKAPHVLDSITAGQPTVGLRVPNHASTLRLLKCFGRGLAAPSANRFGGLSPTTAEAVYEELGDAVDLILDGGQSDIGVESTIVDLTLERPMILRSGAITQKEIEAVLGEPVLVKKQESHVEPKTPIKLMSSTELDSYFEHITQKELPLIALLYRPRSKDNVDCVLMPRDPKKYAHEIYQTLRDADKKNAKQIIIEKVPETEEWKIVAERLRKLES